jgi:hypothetical protein
MDEPESLDAVRNRMRAKLREVKEELRQRMHQPIPEQGRWLRQVVAGFFAHTPCRPTAWPRAHSITMSPTNGGVRFAGAAKRIA